MNLPRLFAPKATSRRFDPMPTPKRVKKAANGLKMVDSGTNRAPKNPVTINAGAQFVGPQFALRRRAVLNSLFYLKLKRVPLNS